jgi:hypothetical protein
VLIDPDPDLRRDLKVRYPAFYNRMNPENVISGTECSSDYSFRGSYMTGNQVIE